MKDQSAPVKRPYRPVKRAESARKTRLRILQAAHRLFVAEGYPATTIARVAVEAGVVAKTVHLTFGTKARLLDSVIQAAIAGDDDERPISAGHDWHEMLAAPPDELLERFAAMVASIHERTAELLAVAEVAAASDPELAELRAEGYARRLSDFSRLVRALQKRGTLRPGLGAGEATGSVFVLASDTTYRLLVGELGWSPPRYRRWLARTLEAALICPADAG